MRTSYVFGSVVLALGLGALAGCAAEEGGEFDELLPEDVDGDGKADTNPNPFVSDDSLNGLWIATVDGDELPEPMVIESWAAVGIRLHNGEAVHDLSRDGDTLTGDVVSLTVQPNQMTVLDDSMEGTIDGHEVVLERDTRVKPSITLELPADRPYRVFLETMLIPAAQQDRESYVTLRSSTIRPWLQSAELYKAGSWIRKFKGNSFSEQKATFHKVINSVDFVKATPRTLIRNVKFAKAITENLKDPTQAGLMLSTFTMYFSTAAGRAVRIPIADTTTYFITDRPSRAEKIGLVAMTTPLHGPLASTFGRQLLDMGAMEPSDDTLYARSVMELLAKSDPSTVEQMSPAGRSAIADWYAVMAIEDYRGVAFGNPDLGWGPNMTNVQFYGLVARALARPGQTDSAGKPVKAQVIVDNELRPGDPSYADVLNGGNDMQEFEDMSRLKQLATQFLRENHPDEVARVEAAFAGIIPMDELSFEDQEDIFRFVSAQLYDTQGRTANLTGAQADEAVEAVVALFAVLAQDSVAFEEFVLANGISKSNEAAPISTGF